MAVDEADSSVAPGDERRREVEELKFLVGTSCSRLTNLLIDRETARPTLAAEAAFMAERGLIKTSAGADQALTNELLPAN